MLAAQHGKGLEHSQLDVGQWLHEHGIYAILAIEHKSHPFFEMFITQPITRF